MNNIKKLEAAKELVKKYNSITIEEIEQLEEGKNLINIYRYGEYIANIITGFGECRSCPLCRVVYNCDRCIYNAITIYSCNRGPNEKTYEEIRYAKNKIELITAIKERAKHLQSLIDKAESL